MTFDLGTDRILPGPEIFDWIDQVKTDQFELTDINDRSYMSLLKISILHKKLDIVKEILFRYGSSNQDNITTCFLYYFSYDDIELDYFIQLLDILDEYQIDFTRHEIHLFGAVMLGNHFDCFCYLMENVFSLDIYQKTFSMFVTAPFVNPVDIILYMALDYMDIRAVDYLVENYHINQEPVLEIFLDCVNNSSAYYQYIDQTKPDNYESVLQKHINRLDKKTLLSSNDRKFIRDTNCTLQGIRSPGWLRIIGRMNELELVEGDYSIEETNWILWGALQNSSDQVVEYLIESEIDIIADWHWYHAATVYPRYTSSYLYLKKFSDYIEDSLPQLSNQINQFLVDFYIDEFDPERSGHWTCAITRDDISADEVIKLFQLYPEMTQHFYHRIEAAVSNLSIVSDFADKALTILKYFQSEAMPIDYNHIIQRVLTMCEDIELNPQIQPIVEFCLRAKPDIFYQYEWKSVEWICDLKLELFNDNENERDELIYVLLVNVQNQILQITYPTLSARNGLYFHELARDSRYYHEKIIQLMRMGWQIKQFDSIDSAIYQYYLN